MTITQEIFETYCPAFRDPLGETYNNVRPYLEAATADLHERFAPGAHLDDVKDAAEAFVCYTAAYEATPALDLIATPNGFAVVNNQNLAPASKERVAALRESFRQSKSRYVSGLIILLTRFPDYVLPAALASLPLLPTASHCRNLGIYAKGVPFFGEEEYAKVRTHLVEAEHRLAGLISEEQVEHLRSMQWIFENRIFRLDVSDLNTAEMPLLQLCREYLTAEVVSHMENVETLWRGSLRTNAAVIIDYVTRHEYELPIYAASSVAEANRTKPYENQANDPTFFFA